jgi:hypothetical protein
VLALSVLVIAAAPALAPWRVAVDATVQVKKACVDGVVLDVGARTPREFDSEPSSTLPTQDVVVQARTGDPMSGDIVLTETVTLPLDLRVIKMDAGPRIIDYYKRFTLSWDQPLEVGQEVSVKAASVAALDGGGDVNDANPATATVKNCRLFK